MDNNDIHGAPDGGVEVADFIFALRSQLEQANSQASGDLQFEVGPVTLEFSVVTTRDGNGHAGIKFWVIDVGGSTSFATEATQKIVLELRPTTLSGSPYLVGDIEPRSIVANIE